MFYSNYLLYLIEIGFHKDSLGNKFESEEKDLQWLILLNKLNKQTDLKGQHNFCFTLFILDRPCHLSSFKQCSGPYFALRTAGLFSYWNILSQSLLRQINCPTKRRYHDRLILILRLNVHSTYRTSCQPLPPPTRLCRTSNKISRYHTGNHIWHIEANEMKYQHINNDT